MKILIGCECSGIMREAFIKEGHDAWSCDIEPTEIPGNHIQDNVLNHLDEDWDLMIAHPPCTFLCRNRAHLNDIEGAQDAQDEGREFFMKLWNSDIHRICIENPVPALNSGLPPYTQIIQPYYFGHDHSKKTCLWLKNLPPLIPTKRVQLSYITTPNGFKYTKGWYETPRTSIARSRTFPGIANAMASQWSYDNMHKLSKIFKRKL